MRWAKQIVQEGFHRPDAEFVAFKAMFGEGSLVMLRHKVNSMRPSWCSHGISTEKEFPSSSGFLCKSESKQSVSVHPQ